MESIHHYEIPDRYTEGEAWHIEGGDSLKPSTRAVGFGAEPAKALGGGRSSLVPESGEISSVAETPPAPDGRPVIPLECTILIGGFPRAVGRRL
jgi:hypothetical protein